MTNIASSDQLLDDSIPSLYIKVIIQGFVLQIHREIAQHPLEAQELYVVLEKQLRTVVESVPVGALHQLQQVTIWVEWDNGCEAAARYHPSRSWLEENGANPDKAQCVEINATLKFIQWSHTQPWMILHELAHAYHFQVLGENNKNIQIAFQQAREKKLYDCVEYDGRLMLKAYAITNDKEYFAELSEAYFGRNDYYPYTHEDLKKHDYIGYQLMVSSWNSKDSC
ncbi:MAG: hypothetical protein KAH22_09850 [Thiotrichaceae bacterium]|nr:hypothetical protein [Thiotrichaceae bacterium]